MPIPENHNEINSEAPIKVDNSKWLINRFNQFFNRLLQGNNDTNQKKQPIIETPLDIEVTENKELSPMEILIDSIVSKQKAWKKEQWIVVDMDTPIDFQKDLVCVDINGTLLIWQELQSSVVDTMLSLLREGKYVIIYTSGNKDRNSEKLFWAGLDNIFLPVLSKSDFRNIHVAISIDDELPKHLHGKHIDPRSLGHL
jgi:hypothetical protein